MSDDQLPVPADAPLSEGEASELSSLKAEMSDTKGAHFSGHWTESYWNNETKQARARELMAREAGTEARDAPPPPGASSQAPSAGGIVPAGGRAPVNVAELAGLANTLDISSDAVEAGYDAALAIEAGMGTSAGDVNMAVAGLPDSLRAAMVRELSSAYVPRQPEADQAAVEAFKRTGAGVILAREWGGDLARRLGIALARVERFENTLDDASFRAWQDFWKHRLRSQEQAAILRTLTG